MQGSDVPHLHKVVLETSPNGSTGRVNASPGSFNADTVGEGHVADVLP